MTKRRYDETQRCKHTGTRYLWKALRVDRDTGAIVSMYDHSPWKPGVWRHENVRGLCLGLNACGTVYLCLEYVNYPQVLAVVEVKGDYFTSDGHKFTNASMRIVRYWIVPDPEEGPNRWGKSFNYWNRARQRPPDWTHKSFNPNKARRDLAVRGRTVPFGEP